MITDVTEKITKGNFMLMELRPRHGKDDGILFFAVESAAFREPQINSVWVSEEHWSPGHGSLPDPD